jgi:16S rRNA (guanine1207-N2)-methyltransferase
MSVLRLPSALPPTSNSGWDSSEIRNKQCLVNPALETLMLAFSAEDGPTIPWRTLFIGAQTHPELKVWPELLGWQPLKPLADAWDHSGFARADELPAGKWPVVLVLPGKSRDETLLWFALAKDRLEPGGRIVAAMPNTAGAARFEKELARATGRITSHQKHKCRAFHAQEDGSWNESLFDEWRALGQARVIPDTGLTTCAGIFSSDHIDPGSQLLASHLPASLHGRVADLGAGWGFLADAALRHCPKIERIDLYEADSRALACAKRNLARHLPPENPLSSPVCYACEEPRVRFHWHDVTTGLPETYDAIVMNPPFHSGQTRDSGLGAAFLTVAAAALKRNGKLYLVANRQLPYEAVLDSLRLHWRKPAEDTTYKVICAEKR